MEYGVSEARCDQDTNWECYVVMLEMDYHLLVMNIVDQQVVVEPAETVRDREIWGALGKGCKY